MNDYNESKKLDTLIKIGLGFILLSGIVFVTSSWNSISNIFKLILLVIFGMSSYGLSIFTDKQLKLPKSSFMYWLLSVISLVIFIIGVGYFGVFGTYLSFDGEGRNLIFTILYLVIGCSLIRASDKVNNKIFLNVSWLFIVLSLYNFFTYVGMKYFHSLVLLSILLSIIRFIKIDNKYYESLYKVSGILLTLLFYPIFFYKLFILDSNNMVDVILGFIETILVVMNVTVLYIEKNNTDKKLLLVISPIIAYLIDVLVIVKGSALINCQLLIIAFSVTLITYSIMFNKDKDLLRYLSLFYNAAILITLIVLTYQDLWFSLLYAVIGLGMSLYLYKLYNNISELCAVPFKIFSVLYVILALCHVTSTTSLCGLIVLHLIIYLILDYLDMNKYLKYSYLVLYNTLLLLGTSFFSNEYYNPSLIIYMLYVVVFINLILDIFILLDVFKKTNKLKIFIYIFITFVLLEVLENNLFTSSDTYIFISQTLLLICFGFINIDDKFTITKINLLVELVPLMSFLSIVDGEYVGTVISSYLIFVGVTFVHIFGDDSKYITISKWLFGISCFLLFIGFSTVDTIVLWGLIIYVIILGYFDDRFSELFKVYIGLLILSIIIKFYDFWSSLGLAFYLFVIGVGIIAFVTKVEYDKSRGIESKFVKRLKETNKKKVIEEKRKVEEVKSLDGARFCTECGNPMKKDAKFCTKCGNSNESSRIYCTNCGASQSSNRTFCTSCGKKLKK